MDQLLVITTIQRILQDPAKAEAILASLNHDLRNAVVAEFQNRSKLRYLFPEVCKQVELTA
jgi:3',5'-cyclic AMP phosphodiesterase CpdA